MAEELIQDSICRLCLKTSSVMENLFTSTADYKLIIEDFTGLKLKEVTGLPSMICGGCIEILNILLEFRERCKKSQEILQGQENLMKMDANKSEGDVSSFLNIKVENKSEEEYNEPDNNDIEFKPPIESVFSNFYDLSSQSSSSSSSSSSSELDYEPPPPSKTRKSNKQTKIQPKKQNSKSGEGSKSKKSKTNNVKNKQSKTTITVKSESEVMKTVKSESENSTTAITSPAATSTTSKTTNLTLTTTPSSSKEKQCYICGKMIHKMGIEFHLNIHLGRRPFKCKVEGCGKAYPSPRELRQHNTFNHSKLEPHGCEICGRRYKTRPQLKAHIETHTNPKTPCNLCGKLFRNRESLDKHLLDHTGECPFKCDECFKGFKDQWSLKVHLKKAHGKEEPLVCASCGMPFGSNADLKRHMKRNHPESEDSFIQAYEALQNIVS